MNLSMLDREQLEAIVLGPSVTEGQPPPCGDPQGVGERPAGETARERRLRHVLAAAHELLVRIANHALISRRFMDTSTLTKEYLTIHFAGAQQELFAAVFLDTHLRVIAAETLFMGTLTETSVHPREIVRRTLHHNAAFVVFAHNHPNGIAEPSRADELLTGTLGHALATIGAHVVDHYVVSGASMVSLAENGLL